MLSNIKFPCPIAVKILLKYQITLTNYRQNIWKLPHCKQIMLSGKTSDLSLLRSQKQTTFFRECKQTLKEIKVFVSVPSNIWANAKLPKPVWINANLS